jgi:uncharacterized OB-fold protein
LFGLCSESKRYQMAGTACSGCGEVVFSPREVCLYCAKNASLLFPANVEKLAKETTMDDGSVFS